MSANRLLLAIATLLLAPAVAGAQAKPNMLVIYGDDVGQSNISAYSRGLMGYQTPNIDRLAQEGMMFTDYYAEQSCTAGRSTFITGQVTLRTGLAKVGIPGADIGLRKEDVTLAEVLRSMGYSTAQFGKNHLGDKDEFLPTVHGFEEFFGNLYHLNAEEEPENVDYPKDPEFRKRFGPRGVLRCVSSGSAQKCEDTGPLTKKRMETVDDEFANAAVAFIEREAEAKRPFFVWFNSTRMHLRTHVRPEYLGRSGIGFYADGMLEHDGHVGQLLKKLDDLGIAENTIVVYTTDNGPNIFSWPDAGMTPFRSEKNTNWEGAYRVPAFVRWPGRIRPGSVSNEVVAGLDWFPTLVAAAGDPGIKEKLLKGARIGSSSYKVHLDGYDLLPYLTGQQPKSPREEFFYFNDEGQLVALRYRSWKWVFCEQRAPGTFEVWAEPFTCLRVPKIFNLRMDPYERADVTSITYYDWMLDHAFMAVPSQQGVARFLATFKEFPPRQRPATFSVDQVLEVLREGRGQ